MVLEKLSDSDSVSFDLVSYLDEQLLNFTDSREVDVERLVGGLSPSVWLIDHV